MLTTLERRDALHQEIARLRRQRDEAREAARQLREMLAPPLAFPLAWRLSPAESRLLSALYSHPNGMTREALHTVIERDIEIESEIKIVDVFVCKLRAKVTAHGIKIRTLWARGYVLSEGRELVGAAIAYVETTRRELRHVCGVFTE